MPVSFFQGFSDPWFEAVLGIKMQQHRFARTPQTTVETQAGCKEVVHSSFVQKWLLRLFWKPFSIRLVFCSGRASIRFSIIMWLKCAEFLNWICSAIVVKRCFKFVGFILELVLFFLDLFYHPGHCYDSPVFVGNKKQIDPSGRFMLHGGYCICLCRNNLYKVDMK